MNNKDSKLLAEAYQKIFEKQYLTEEAEDWRKQSYTEIVDRAKDFLNAVGLTGEKAR